MGIWAIRSPLKIYFYTCMSFKTCWSRLIYTKLSSHRSFVLNMYIVTMALRCISLWSFHRSPQRRRKMDIFRYSSRFLRILSKNNQKKNVLERYIGLEPWDLFLLKIKCYRKCLQNYKGTIFGVAWTEKNRFEIINAVTDEPKVTIFSNISLIISTDQRYWTERSPFSSWWAGHLSGKLKRPLTSTRVNLREIALFSSFFKLVKDTREKSMENNGDEIAVIFPEGHGAIPITY